MNALQAPSLFSNFRGWWTELSVKTLNVRHFLEKIKGAERIVARPKKFSTNAIQPKHCNALLLFIVFFFKLGFKNRFYCLR